MSVWYPATFIVYAIFQLMASGNRFIKFRQTKFVESFGDTDLPVSELFFNGWEFKTNNRIDMKNLRLQTLNLIFTEIKEQKL